MVAGLIRCTECAGLRIRHTVLRASQAEITARCDAQLAAKKFTIASDWAVGVDDFPHAQSVLLDTDGGRAVKSMPSCRMPTNVSLDSGFAEDRLAVHRDSC